MPAIPALRDYLKTRRSVGIGFLKDPGPTEARSQAIRHESWESRLDDIRRHLATM